MSSDSTSVRLQEQSASRWQPREDLWRTLAGGIAGLLFGLGLVVAGMSNPAKVLSFLDVFGAWDPSLILVMAGAAATALIGFRLVWRRQHPVLSDDFAVPTRKDIDAQLLIGAALFGAGWGIGGYCPGPAWTSVSTLAPGAITFLLAMVIGMALASWWKQRR